MIYVKKITIITVTLNPFPEDLKKTIQSVINQKYDNWELIIQDGGTTNKSLDVVPEDTRIKVYTERDCGIYDAMNKAIEKSTGDYICMLNSGDYIYDKTVLECIAEYSEKYKEVDFFYGNVNKPQSRSAYEVYPKKIKKPYLFRRMICHQAWFVKKGYYEGSHKYRTEYIVDGDRDFLLNMIIADKVNYKKINKVLVVYKGGGVSQKYQNDNKRITDYNDITKKYFNKYEILIYEVAWNIRQDIKKVFYDKYFSKVFKIIQRKRVGID